MFNGGLRHSCSADWTGTNKWMLRHEASAVTCWIRVSSSLGARDGVLLRGGGRRTRPPFCCARSERGSSMKGSVKLAYRCALVFTLYQFAIASSASAQYMYLDSNGNGLHDAGDQVSSPETTTLDIWLDSDTNRPGARRSTASCQLTPAVAYSHESLASRQTDTTTQALRVNARPRACPLPWWQIATRAP